MDAHGAGWWARAVAATGREARYTWRALRKSRGFTCTTTLILALCVGANAAIFSLLYALVLEPLPFPHAERVVEITNSYPKAGIANFHGNVPQYLYYAAQAEAFTDFALFRQFGSVFPDDGATRTGIARVTPEFFAVLGVRPLVGGFFAAGHSTPGEDRVLVLTQSFWESHYGGDRDVVGRTMRLGDDVYTILGVAPRAVEAVDRTVGVIKPLPWANEWLGGEMGRHGRGFVLRGQLLGRLQPGVTPEQARLQLTALDRHFYEAASSEYQKYVDDSGYTVRLETLQNTRLGPARQTLFLLQGAALFVLLIGCVNVANLLLARANARQSELAVRSALGAGRAVIARHLALEALLLAASGGVLGILLGWVGVKLANRFALPLLPPTAPITLDGTTIVFACGLSLAVGVVIGVAPVWHVFRTNLLDVIRRGSGNASPSRKARAVGSLLVSGQVALSLMLLTGTGLLLHSLARVTTVPAGIDTHQVLTVRTGVSGTRFSDAAAVDRLQDRIMDGLRQLPGVEAVALATHTPLLEAYPVASLFVPGGEMTADAGQPTTQQVGVSPDYFSTLGIPLRRGRAFDRRDDAPGARHVVIDQRLAERFFPGQDPVGHRLGLGRQPTAESQWWTIIGVVGDVRHNGLDEVEALPFVYHPVRQFRFIGHSFFVRSNRPPAELLTRMRETIRATDSQLPVLHSARMHEHFAAALDDRRALLLLLGLFAGLALLLAALGLYGVLAYDVSQRTREIGIRGAIGATRGQVLALFLRQGCRRTMLGVAFGLGGALGLSRVMTSLLFGVSPYDPVTLVATSLVLLGTGVLASLWPALRAARINPTVALRTE